MKTRVLRQLGELAENPQNDMMDYLTDALELEPRQIAERSGTILRNMLHNYADLGISTIDKFTHQLVRAFSRDLMLNHDFEVDTNQDPFLEEAVARLIDRVGRDPLTTELLIDFVESQLDNDRSWAVENTLSSAGAKQLGLQSEPYLNLLEDYPVKRFAELKKELYEYCRSFEKDIQSAAARVMEAFSKNQLEEHHFYYGKSGIHKYFQNLAEGHVDKEPNSYVRKSLEEEKFESSKASPEQVAAISALAPLMHQVTREVEEIKKDREPLYLLCKELLKNLHQLLLLNELRKTLVTLKEERNMVFVDDFHRLISGVVKDEPAPFIYERIGQRYRHLLIDEFQDTSILQWQNFLPLVSDSLASGGVVLLVGDGKQAIYRWRGGEVEQFDRLPSVYPPANDPVMLEREQLLKLQYNPQHLDKNYRSLGAVVHFNNTLYDHLQQFVPEDLRSVYSDVEQNVVKKEDAGLVTFDLLEFESGTRADERGEVYLRTTEKYIAEALEDGYAPRDICLIVRNNKLGRLLADYLQNKVIGDREIEVISNESLLIDSHPSVQLALSAMRWLSDPTHTGSAADFLIRLIRYHEPGADSHQVLMEFTRRCDKNKLDTVRINAYLQSRKKPTIDEQLLTMNLYEMTEELARRLGSSSFNNPYWSFFKQQVLGFSNDKGNDLPAFLHWWEEQRDKLSLSIPEDSDAIRLMTVHKSKGLQFPVVIMPFADWTMKMNSALHWAVIPEEASENFTTPLPAAMLTGLGKAVEGSVLQEAIETENSRNALDNLNLLYVGTTRAEERLYLISYQSEIKNNSASHVGQWLTAFAEEKGLTEFPVRFGRTGHRSQYDDSPQKPQEKSQSALPPFPVSQNKGWTEKIRISLEAGELIDGQISPTSRATGNLVHRILSEIERPEELEARLQWHLDRGVMDEKLSALISEQIQKMFDHPEAGNWFKTHDSVLNEQALVSPDGTISRPDRILIDGNRATVIDFKTGEYREEHEAQIQQYGQLLTSMNYECELRLYYLEQGEVRAVSPSDQTSLF